MWVQVCIRGLRIVRPDPFSYLRLFPVQELSLVSWKAATQTARNDKPSTVESVRAAAEFSTPTSHVQYSHSRKCGGTANGSLLHYSSVAGGMMQKWCKRGASFATRWPSGRGLPTPQQTSGAQANSQSSCQLREWEREGLAVPAGRCQRRGNQAGCLAAWLSGWQGGCAVGSGITLHRCANSSSAQHLCPPAPLPLYQLPPIPPPSLHGRTHRCLQSSPLSLKSDQNNHRWLWIGRGACRLFTARMRHLAIHKTPPALLWRQAKR